ncbi:MAG: glycosyltransferase family 9 protein [Fusobacteriaceae bacterium]
MEIKRILVSRTDKIGDLVLSIPSFFMLKKMYPEAEITVLVRKYNYEIVKNLPYVDRVIKIDDYTEKSLIDKIGYFKADVFIALYNDSFVSKLVRKSGAKIKIGPYSKLSSFFVFNKGVYQKRSKSIKNEAEYNLDLVKKLNPDLFREKYELNTNIILEDKNREVATLFYSNHISLGKKVLVINPFMGGSAKNLKDSQYTSLMKKILERDNDIDIILTVHINDEERAQNLLEGLDSKKVHIFANGGELLNTAAIIEKCDLYLGGSTGPTHIAGALQKEIVAIYPNLKTQSPKRWGVFGNIKVEYLIPDYKNKKENYSHKEFDSYNEDLENLLVKTILNKI